MFAPSNMLDILKESHSKTNYIPRFHKTQQSMTSLFNFTSNSICRNKHSSLICSTEIIQHARKTAINAIVCTIIVFVSVYSNIWPLLTSLLATDLSAGRVRSATPVAV